MLKNRISLLAGLGVSALLAVSAQADVSNTLVTLEDRNSTLDIDWTSSGMVTNWRVDNVGILANQGFWYRLGGQTQETPVTNLVEWDHWVANNNRYTGNESFTISYQDTPIADEPNFVIDIGLNLKGGSANSRTSDLRMAISLTNYDPMNALTISFFHYSDFDLNGTTGADTAWFPYGTINTVRQVDNATGWTVETVVTPTPQRWELTTVSTTLDKLNNGTADNLSNANPSVTGNVSWAYQWDLVIAPNSTVIISEDQNVLISAVPLPPTVWMAGVLLGGMTVNSIRRRRRAA